MSKAPEHAPLEEAAASSDGEDASSPATLESLQRRAAIAELMAGTIHDSRNIMTGVLSFAQIGQRRSQDEDAQGLFTEIAGEAVRCVDLMEEVLKLLRGDEFSGDDAVPVALKPLVASVSALVRGEARLKRIDVVFDAVDALQVLGHEPSVLQVVLNLVINAVQATPLDGSVQISTRVCGEDVEIRVADTGAGVPCAQRDKIFNSFFSTKGKSGTGIGLTTSRVLARRLGGDVVLEPRQDGFGATFCIRLPLAPMPEGEER